MSTNGTERWLRAYVEEGSESAFREIVARYINLVYSVALRRTAGDTQLAQEITQRVFIDLSQKAKTLPLNLALGGWLHRHTCFVAGTVTRSETRRRQREQEAVFMNVLQPETDAGWKELAPALDEAVDGLPDPDRAAILLRFFEQQDFRTIGQALAISEDAAQKRVSRALDKLREVLRNAGVVLSTTALSTLLTANATVSAPAGVVTALMKGVVPATGAGAIAFLLKLLSSAALKKAALVLLTAGVVALIALRNDRRPGEEASAQHNLATVVRPAEPRPADGKANAWIESDQLAGAVGGAVELQLTIVADDSGRPVPNVPVEFRRWESKAFNKGMFQSTRAGVCDVTFPRDTTTQLELTTRVDGFGDTRLRWQVERSDVIPTNYTVRLVRAQPIGGRVVDADGEPVANAKVGFNHEQDPQETGRIETHEFGWIEVETDAVGRWSINRIAPEMVRRLYGAARHPEHVDAKFLQVREDSEAERQLKESTHVFHFGRPISIPGMVVDSEGHPIAGASILVGQHDEVSSRKAKSAYDGSFTVKGCKPGLNAVSAEAPGFSVTTVSANASAEMEPIRLVLRPGRALHLRVLYANGTLATNAAIVYEQLHAFNESPPTQVRFSAQTDARGEAIWSNAPSGPLTFSVVARDSMVLRGARVEAEETEHTFQLAPALVVTGSVRDAESGARIERHRIVCGWPETDVIRDGFRPQWTTMAEYWLTFSRSEFRHVFTESLGPGNTNRGYVLKFEAEGYAPFVSRVIAADEGAAHLDVRLSKGAETLVTVQLPNGRPAEGAELGLISHGVQLELGRGRFTGPSAHSGVVLRTDARGQVKLSSDPGVTRVFIAHGEGFSDTTLTVLQRDPEVRLTPWGRVMGRYYREGKPVEGAELVPRFLAGADPSLHFGFNSFKAVTDAAGRYSIENLPPGELRLIHLEPMPTPSGMTWMNTTLGTVHVRSGETTTNDIGVNVKRVVARVQLPVDLPAKDLRVFVFLSTIGPEPPDEIAADDNAHLAWKSAPDRAALLSRQRVFMLAEQPNGTWMGHDVEPGNYTLKARAMEFNSETERLTLVGFGRKFDMTVPADSGDAAVDLGTLAVVSSVKLLSRSAP